MISETVIDAMTVNDSLSATEADKDYAVASFDKTSAGYKHYREDLEKFGPKVALGESSALAWLAVNMFADVAPKLPSITRKAVYDAIGSSRTTTPTG